MNILNLSIEYPKSNSFVDTDSDNVYVCTNPPETAVRDKSAIQIPNDEFDIMDIIGELKWKPDLVSISSSLSILKNPPIPKGIEKLKCPSVMKFTDSHHMYNSTRTLIEFARSVNCDYHWTTYNRNHVHFFKAAMLKNVFWLPGSISIPFYEVKGTQKRYSVGFCGTLQSGHPVRKNYLTYLQQQNIDVTIERETYEESLEFYSASQIAFNCSLNGDLNRRVFEVLMAGGFLLTDRLSDQSGLTALFKEGTHIECYANKEELLEKVNYYLAHPAAASRIAEQGRELSTKEYHPEIINKAFRDIVFNQGSSYSKFVDVSDKRGTRPGATSKGELNSRLALYELVQEIHRVNTWLNLLVVGGGNDIICDLGNLPRLSLSYYCYEDSKNELGQVLEYYQLKERINIIHDLSHQQYDIVVVLDDSLADVKFNEALAVRPPMLLITTKAARFRKVTQTLLKKNGFKQITIIEPGSNKAIATIIYMIFVRKGRAIDNPRSNLF